MDDETYIRMQVSRGPGRMRPFAPEVLYYCSHGTGWYLGDALLFEISPLPVLRAQQPHICAMRGRFDTGCLSASARCRLIYINIYIYLV